MTLKTPEQIAYAQTALYAQNDFATDAPSVARALIIAAIEADRAQRTAALDALHAWAVSMSDFMSTDKCNDWSEELTRLVEIEREHNLVDDDEEPTSADERDYGKYLDQQFWGDHD